MRPVGWRGQSYRHYLASKGIRSTWQKQYTPKMYMLAKEDAEKYSEVLGGMFDDGRADVGDLEETHKKRVAEEEFRKCSDELSKLEVEGKINSGAAERFRKDDLTNETKDYIDSKIDEATYKKNLSRRLHKHKQQHSSSFDPWDTGDHHEDSKFVIFGSLEPSKKEEAEKAAFSIFGSDEQAKGGLMFFAKKRRRLAPWEEKRWKDRIKGGRADALKPTQFDYKELMRGQKHEMEHTENPMIATEIAMDHLTEDPDYYKLLRKLERGK
jgi:hypothetical protein